MNYVMLLKRNEIVRAARSAKSGSGSAAGFLLIPCPQNMGVSKLILRKAQGGL